MSKLKPLPKALLVGVLIAGAGFATYKFLPERQPEPVQISDTPVPAAETPVAATPAPTVAPAPAPAPQVAEPAPQPGNVTNGGAGLDSVLKAGSKK